MAPRWKPGVFLGYSRDSHEYAVWDIEGLVIEGARSIKKAPPEDRHSLHLIEQVRRRPQDMLQRAAMGWKT